MGSKTSSIFILAMLFNCLTVYADCNDPCAGNVVSCVVNGFTQQFPDSDSCYTYTTAQGTVQNPYCSKPAQCNNNSNSNPCAGDVVSCVANGFTQQYPGYDSCYSYMTAQGTTVQSPYCSK
jgi:hypothetical protein